MKVELTRHTPDPVMAIEEAAANCYDSKPNPDGWVMMSCYYSGHHSVLEMVNFTFHVEGISRACLAQLSRHRHISLSVRSQRYAAEDSFTYYEPTFAPHQEDAKLMYKNCIEYTQTVYNELVRSGIAKEDARMVLPNACHTVLEVSMNLRELIHLANLRLCTRSQKEIRELVQAMCDEVLTVMPQAKVMLVPKCEVHAPYCFCTEHKSCGRHPKIEDAFKSEQEGSWSFLKRIVIS